MHTLVWLIEHPAEPGEANDQYTLVRLLADAAMLLSEAIPHDHEEEADDPFVGNAVHGPAPKTRKRTAKPEFGKGTDGVTRR